MSQSAEGLVVVMMMEVGKHGLFKSPRFTQDTSDHPSFFLPFLLPPFAPSSISTPCPFSIPLPLLLLRGLGGQDSLTSHAAPPRQDSAVRLTSKGLTLRCSPKH